MYERVLVALDHSDVAQRALDAARELALLSVSYTHLTLPTICSV